MSEYLSEEEQIAKMKSWWDENGTSTIIGIVVVVAALGGWRWYGSYQQEQAYEGSRAYAAYLNASASEKASAAAAVAADFPGSAYHVFVLFQQAKDALAAGDLASAEASLTEAVEAADDPLLADLAKVRLAKVQNGLDRSADALNTLASLSNEGYRTWGLEAKGDIHFARGELALAHEAYRAALEALPPGDQRPVLEMKLKNVAPFEGQYVGFADTLGDALEQAQQTLDEAAATVEATATGNDAPEQPAVEPSAAVETQAPAPGGADTEPQND